MKNRDTGDLLSLFNSSGSITISTPEQGDKNVSESDFKTNSNKLLVNNAMAFDIIMLLQLMGKDLQFIKTIKSAENSEIAILTCDIDTLMLVQFKMSKKGFRFCGERQWRSLKKWIKEISYEANLIYFHVPTIYGNKRNEYHIHFRKNTGEDLRILTDNLSECARKTSELKNPTNYMVCIEENGERILRWDKEIIFNSNKWKPCPPDELEIIGKIPVIEKING